MIIPSPTPIYSCYFVCHPQPHSYTHVWMTHVWMTPVQRKQLQFSFPILELYQAREIFYKNQIVLITAGNRPPKVTQVNIFKKFVYLSTKCVFNSFSKRYIYFISLYLKLHLHIIGPKSAIPA